MGRDMYHSAEGTHWTKKNHKYIRKEGNRYIYPQDYNDRKSLRELKRSNAMYQQGRDDYRQAGVQRANRNSAANGAGSMDYRDRNANRANTLSNRSAAVNRQASPDYRELSKSGAGAAGRYATSRQTSPNYQGISTAQRRQTALNSQGSSNYREASRSGSGAVSRLANSSQEYAKQLSARHAGKMRKERNLNNQGSDSRGYDYAREQAATNSIASRRNNVNGSTVSDYKEASREARRNNPNTLKQVSDHYRDVRNRQNRQAGNRAKAANGEYTDYKTLSSEHRANDPDVAIRERRHAQEEMYERGRTKNAIKRGSTAGRNRYVSKIQNEALDSQNSPDYRSISEIAAAKSNLQNREEIRKRHKKAIRKEVGKETVKKLLNASNEATRMLIAPGSYMIGRAKRKRKG